MSIIQVTKKHINSLEAEDFRDLLGELLRAECVKFGVNPSCVSFSGNHLAGDGGIDVSVCIIDKSIKLDGAEGFLTHRNMIIQAKAVKNFSRQSVINEINGETVQRSLKELSKNGGGRECPDNCVNSDLASSVEMYGELRNGDCPILYGHGPFFGNFLIGTKNEFDKSIFACERLLV